MLNTTSKTAVKAVIFLASKSGTEEKTGILETAEGINASAHTVGKILQVLARKGFIKSVKGPSGGFYMDEQQRECPLIEIISAVEDKPFFTRCGLGLSHCSDCRPCPIHEEYKQLQQMIERVFHEKTVNDFSGRLSTGLTHLIG
jgi:Rrf2 family protein